MEISYGDLMQSREAGPGWRGVQQRKRMLDHRDCAKILWQEGESKWD